MATIHRVVTDALKGFEFEPILESDNGVVSILSYGDPQGEAHISATVEDDTLRLVGVLEDYWISPKMEITFTAVTSIESIKSFVKLYKEDFNEQIAPLRAIDPRI